jgi:hypothetical protein
VQIVRCTFDLHRPICGLLVTRFLVVGSMNAVIFSECYVVDYVMTAY